MKLLVMLAIAGMLYGLPLWAYNDLVKPQLTQLQYTYSHADEIAQRAAGVDAAPVAHR